MIHAYPAPSFTLLVACLRRLSWVCRGIALSLPSIIQITPAIKPLWTKSRLRPSICRRFEEQSSSRVESDIRDLNYYHGASVTRINKDHSS